MIVSRLAVQPELGISFGMNLVVDAEAVEDCKVWLLKQKQTQDWKTTKATADAVYALLLRGDNLLASAGVGSGKLRKAWKRRGEIRKPIESHYYRMRLVRHREGFLKVGKWNKDDISIEFIRAGFENTSDPNYPRSKRAVSGLSDKI